VVYQVEKNMDRRTKLRMFYARASVIIFFAILAPSAWFGMQNLVSVSVSDKIEAKNKENLQLLGQRMDTALSKAEGQFKADTQQKFSALETQIQVDTLHLSLIAGIIYLDVSNDYVQEDVDILMRNFAKADKLPALKEKTDFPLIVDKAISSLMRLNELNNLYTLENQFPKIIASNPQTVNRLVVFYGEQLVGSIYPPNRWSAHDMKQFQTYLQLAQGSNQYVQYLPIDILVEYRLAGEKPSSTIDALVTSISKLSPEQQLSVLTTLVKYSDASFWQASPDSSGLRMAEVTTQFLKAYEKPLLALAQQPAVNSLMKSKLQSSSLHHRPLHEAMSAYYLQ
jgi:hypothetical protein